MRVARRVSVPVAGSTAWIVARVGSISGSQALHEEPTAAYSVPPATASDVVEWSDAPAGRTLAILVTGPAVIAPGL